MGKIIKFPGKFQASNPVEEGKVHSSKGWHSIWSTLGILLLGIVSVTAGILIVLLVMILPALMWVLALLSGLSFVLMILMWNQPTYLPMFMFLGTFGLYLGLTFFFTEYEPKWMKLDKKLV